MNRKLSSDSTQHAPGAAGVPTLVGARLRAGRFALITILAAAGVLLTVALPVSAHHSFSAEFDSKQEVTLNGRVARMEWTNPHSWLFIDVEKDGKTERWAVEFGSPNVLFRNGWKKDSLPEGMRVIVHGFPAKDGSLRANSRGVEFPDGRRLDTGSSFGKDGK